MPQPALDACGVLLALTLLGVVVLLFAVKGAARDMPDATDDEIRALQANPRTRMKLMR